MTSPSGDPADRAKFRATLAKVMIVQVVSLVLLWVLQARFSS